MSNLTYDFIKRAIIPVKATINNETKNKKVRLRDVPEDHREAFMNGLSIFVSGYWIKRIK